jgi:hypothetical protein
MKRTILLLCLLVAGIGTSHAQQAPAAADSQGPGDLQLRAYIGDHDRTIHILEKGLKENWRQSAYLSAFKATVDPNTGTVRFNKPFACAGSVRAFLLPREIWDEKMPLNVEVREALDQCRSERRLFDHLATPAK